MTSIIDFPVAVLPIRSAANEERSGPSRGPASPKRGGAEEAPLSCDLGGNTPPDGTDTGERRFLEDYQDPEWVHLEIALDRILFARR